MSTKTHTSVVGAVDAIEHHVLAKMAKLRALPERVAREAHVIVDTRVPVVTGELIRSGHVVCSTIADSKANASAQLIYDAGHAGKVEIGGRNCYPHWYMLGSMPTIERLAVQMCKDVMAGDES